MDQFRFDQATRELSDAIGSRRTALGAVLAAALGGAVGVVTAPADGSAKRKKRKKRNKNKKKNAAALQVAFACPGPGNSDQQVSGATRIGQVFAAERSGSLREVQIGIVKRASTPGDYLVQLLTSIGASPGNSPLDVLAAVTVPDASVPEGASTLVANFAGTELVLGAFFAVVVSRPESDNQAVQIHLSSECSGALVSAAGTDPFSLESGQDVIVSVLVD